MDFEQLKKEIQEKVIDKASPENIVSYNKLGEIAKKYGKKLEDGQIQVIVDMLKNYKIPLWDGIDDFAKIDDDEKKRIIKYLFNQRISKFKRQKVKKSQKVSKSQKKSKRVSKKL